jgi:vesicle coat complex subunit
MDFKGLIHGCLYCRSCGAVHDTIGPLLGMIKILFGRMPSKVLAVYEFSEFKKITRISNPDFSGLGSMNPYIINAMVEDGRLTADDDDLTEEEPTVDFLLECLEEKNFIVRREAIIALRRYEDKRAVAPLIEALRDKNWEVRRNAAITLGEIGDGRAIEPLRKLIETETWEHLVRKAATIAVEKLQRR